MAALLKMSGAWEIQIGSWWKWYVSNDMLVLVYNKQVLLTA